MIENALTVHDDILQKELSSNADDKMKNIVATIQREQNLIIRNEEARTLIIQGSFGALGPIFTSAMSSSVTGKLFTVFTTALPSSSTLGVESTPRTIYSLPNS